MTCARCRRCSRPAGGKGKNEDAFLPPVRLETKKRKGRPWPRAARRRRTMLVVCSARTLALVIVVRPSPFLRLHRSHLARLGCTCLPSQSGSAWSERGRAMTARVLVSHSRSPERPHELMIFLSESNSTRRTNERRRIERKKERKKEKRKKEREENYYSAVAVDSVGEARAPAFPVALPCPALPQFSGRCRQRD